jgi:hypothetical protein
MTIADKQVVGLRSAALQQPKPFRRGIVNRF